MAAGAQTACRCSLPSSSSRHRPSDLQPLCPSRDLPLVDVNLHGPLSEGRTVLSDRTPDVRARPRTGAARDSCSPQPSGGADQNALLNPGASCCRRGDHQQRRQGRSRSAGVTRARSRRWSSPTSSSDALADLFPVAAIGNGDTPSVDGPRRGRSERATALAAVSGDVRLLDKDRVRRAPPFRGAGGAFLILGFWDSLPARALDAGVSAGVFAGVVAGFRAARARKVSDPDRPLAPKPRSRQDTSRPKLSDRDRPLSRKPRSGSDCF